jgi:hypothetical protein
MALNNNIMSTSFQRKRRAERKAVRKSKALRDPSEHDSYYRYLKDQKKAGNPNCHSLIDGATIALWNRYYGKKSR